VVECWTAACGVFSTSKRPEMSLVVVVAVVVWFGELTRQAEGARLAHSRVHHSQAVCIRWGEAVSSREAEMRCGGWAACHGTQTDHYWCAWIVGWRGWELGHSGHGEGVHTRAERGDGGLDEEFTRLQSGARGESCEMLSPGGGMRAMTARCLLHAAEGRWRWDRSDLMPKTGMDIFCTSSRTGQVHVYAARRRNRNGWP